jgi:PAS domain S-box-containing protein
VNSDGTRLHIPFEGPGEDLVRLLLETAPSAVVVVDAGGVIRYVNPRTASTFGYTIEELLGQRIEVLVPGHLAAGHASHRTRFVADPAPRPMGVGLALSGRRKDGSEFPVEISLTPLPMAGDTTWVVAGVTDISARRTAEEHVESLSRAYLTLARVNQAIIRARDPQSLFTDVCRVAVEHGGYVGAWVGAPDADRVIRPLAAAGALGDYIGGLGLCLDPANPTSRGPTAQAILKNQPLYSMDVMSDPRTALWRGVATTYGVKGLGSLPLREGGRTVAVLTLYSPQTDVFDVDMRALLEQVTENVSFALDGYAAARRLEQVATQRTELLRRLVTAQEGERTRLAADIHDEPVQALAAADLRLGLLQSRLATVAPDLEASVTKIQDTLATATGGLRQMLFDLEPLDSDAGCAAVVREAASHIFEDVPLSWTLECDDAVALPDAEQTHALRIIKEALINVRKHALASTVAISIRNQDRGIEVAVSDDGVGLAPDAEARPGHRGLQTMRDRAELAGGWCRLEDRPGGGTTLRFWVPRIRA